MCVEMCFFMADLIPVITWMYRSDFIFLYSVKSTLPLDAVGEDNPVIFTAVKEHCLKMYVF